MHGTWVEIKKIIMYSLIEVTHIHTSPDYSFLKDLKCAAKVKSDTQKAMSRKF